MVILLYPPCDWFAAIKTAAHRMVVELSLTFAGPLRAWSAADSCGRKQSKRSWFSVCGSPDTLDQCPL